MAEQLQTILYVAPNGNDAWSGKLAEPNARGSDGPLATVAGARDAIRAMDTKARVAHPITVYLRGGTYYQPQTLTFEGQDSGTLAAPITYAAYPGETPIISGGKLIRGDWKPYQGQIMACSLPEAANNQWKFRRLIVNGRVKRRARLPKRDYYQIDAPVYESAFKYNQGDIRRFHNLEDVEVVVFHSWDESRLIIKEIDEERQVVTFTGAPERSHYFGWQGVKNRYYLENVREGLAEPGDWYLDARAGELYYWPEEGEDLATAQVVAPILQEVLGFRPDIEKYEWVSYLTFSGLTFCDTDFPLPAAGYPGCGDVGDIIEPSAVELRGARRCAVRDCTIKNTGTYGLFVMGPGNQIIGNEIYDTGSGGIVTRNYTSEHMVVSYNHVHDCGAVYPSACGINIDDGGGIFSHNLIHGIPHSGIYARHWPTGEQPLERQNQEEGLVIEYNEIYDVIATINDGAGIFVRDSDMIIRNNLIHDCYSFGDGTPGWGIYLGCRSRNSRVENNLVYRSRESVHIWYGNEHTTWINNIFVDGLKTQINYGNAVDTRHINIRFLRNIVAWAAPEASLFMIYGERSLPEESDYNVYYQAGGTDLRLTRLEGVENYDQWRARGFDAHSVVADPLFVDPAHDDYTLRPDSPAFKLGFQPLDLTTVGLRGSRWAK